MSDAMMFPETIEEFIDQYKFIDTDQIYTNGSELIQVFRVMQWVEHERALDAEPIRHGHWVGIDDEPCESYECDKCGYITEEIGCNNGIPNNFNYCPNCGAKMDEVEE